ncbi:hypothetical protein AB4Y45_27980 [Paraburkholderia sp. EG287A]|uniref:hypothetical protein n=1 Tax=Paraburkholderia sp. EG287A TaxID=3237012 RepID=UPI0034D2FB9E
MQLVQPTDTHAPQRQTISVILDGLEEAASKFVQTEMPHGLVDRDAAALASVAVSVVRDAFDACTDLTKSGDEIDLLDAHGLYERAMAAAGHIQSAIGALTGSNA